jgi:hypothetical protein
MDCTSMGPDRNLARLYLKFTSLHSLPSHSSTLLWKYHLQDHAQSISCLKSAAACIVVRWGQSTVFVCGTESLCLGFTSAQLAAVAHPHALVESTPAYSTGCQRGLDLARCL